MGGNNTGVNITIECRCGGCIQPEEICPNKYYPFQSASDFCSIARAKKDICDYCVMYQNEHCNNYFFCDVAKQAKDYCDGAITVDDLITDTRNMLVEMGILVE